MVRAFSAGNRFNRRKGRERSKALSLRKALGCCGALPKVQQGSIEQGKASNRRAEKAVFVMACLYSLYKHKALIDSFQREKSGQFPTPQQTYHLAHRAAGPMCVTVHQWQICDAVFSFMKIFRGLTTRKVVGLLRR